MKKGISLFAVFVVVACVFAGCAGGSGNSRINVMTREDGSGTRSAFIELFGGLGLAFLGAALAVGLCCVGSAKGTGMAGEAATGVIIESPENFSKCLILQVLPGTQGLYGMVAWFFVLLTIGVFGGGVQQLTVSQGLTIFCACLPVALGGWLSAIYQGRVAAASINIVAKRPEEATKGIILCGIVEFYAILSLLATILLLMNAL